MTSSAANTAQSENRDQGREATKSPTRFFASFLGKSPRNDGSEISFDERLQQITFRSLKVWIVMTLVSLAIIYAGHKLGSRFGLLIGFLFALSANSLIFFYAEMRLLKLFPGRELEGRDPWNLLEQVQSLSRQLGLKAPRVMLLTTPAPVLFSAGFAPTPLTPHTLFLSQEFLHRLTVDERRTLLAYEMLRIKTQVTSSATAIAAITAFLTALTGSIDRVLTLRLFRSPHEQNLAQTQSLVMGPVTRLISPLVVGLIRLSLSRRAVFELDEATVQWIGKPDDFARALWKMQSYSKTIPLDVSLAHAHLFSINPFIRHRAWAWAVAQPSTPRRLNAISGHDLISIDRVSTS